MDPFGDKDIAGRIEAGVVWMEELARHPGGGIWIAAKFVAVPDDFFAPGGIFAEVRDDRVVFIEKRDARAEVGNKQKIFVRIEVSREDETIEGFEVLAIEGEPLQAFVRTIGHYH